MANDNKLYRIVEYMNGQCDAQYCHKEEAAENEWHDLLHVGRYNNLQEAQDAIETYRTANVVKKVHDIK